MANKHGKKYLEKAELIDASKFYPIKEGLALIRQTNPAKFDATVELAFNLSIDPRRSEQQIRDSLVLPEGTGQKKKILLLTLSQAREGEQAGADYAGGIDLITKIKNGWSDFDIVLATPDIMPRLGEIARLLGPKGLMPSVKNKTITKDVNQAISEIKKGRINYRSDRHGNVHTVIGKTSFSEAQLLANYQAMLQSIKHSRPDTVKGGNYIQNISLSTSMGPGIKILYEI